MRSLLLAAALVLALLALAAAWRARAAVPRWSAVWWRRAGEGDTEWALRVYQYIIGDYRRLDATRGTIIWLGSFLTGLSNLSERSKRVDSMFVDVTAVSMFVGNVCKWYVALQPAEPMTRAKRALLRRTAHLMTCAPKPMAINTPA